MHELDKTDWEILNATADDCENLEQIYRCVCFAIQSDPADNGKVLLRPLANAPLLAELADRVPKLIESGLLVVVMDENGNRLSAAQGPQVVWRGWFAMTPLGRQAWDDSPYAVVEQGQVS